MRPIVLDIPFVREQFPAFSTALGRVAAFFDNAGGSYMAGAVIDRLTTFIREHKVQPYGPHPLAQRAGEAMDHGRRTMAALLNVGVDELTLGASSTQNLNTLAIACAPLVRRGAEVVVTEQDHESNIGGWERLCRRQGAVLRLWKVDPVSGELDLNALDALLNARTAIVCVTHSSNILGSINPVREVAGRARQHGARVVVDGVSYAPHRWPDLDDLGVDAYVFSTYKTYGTHVGAMVVRAPFLAELEPQCHFFNEGTPWKRLDAAGPDHAAIAALAGIGDYFTAVHDHHFGPRDIPLHEKARGVSALMHAHEDALCARLLERLRHLPVRIFGRGTMDGREANIALASDRRSSAELAQGLVGHDVAAKNGHFYAFRLLRAMGTTDLDDGVLRLSLAHYNTREEVDRCAAGLEALLG